MDVSAKLRVSLRLGSWKLLNVLGCSETRALIESDIDCQDMALIRLSMTSFILCRFSGSLVQHC